MRRLGARVLEYLRLDLTVCSHALINGGGVFFRLTIRRSLCEGVIAEGALGFASWP